MQKWNKKKNFLLVNYGIVVYKDKKNAQTAIKEVNMRGEMKVKEYEKKTEHSSRNPTHSNNQSLHSAQGATSKIAEVRRPLPSEMVYRTTSINVPEARRTYTSN